MTWHQQTKHEHGAFWTKLCYAYLYRILKKNKFILKLSNYVSYRKIWLGNGRMLSYDTQVFKFWTWNSLIISSDNCFDMRLSNPIDKREKSATASDENIFSWPPLTKVSSRDHLWRKYLLVTTSDESIKQTN